MNQAERFQNAGWTAGNRLQIIAGPCAIEGEGIAMEVAEGVAEVCAALDLPVVFKVVPQGEPLAVGQLYRHRR